MIAALLLVLATSPNADAPAEAAAPISPEGRIRTEGIRFRLPKGFAYRTGEVQGAPAYVAESRVQRRAVAVTVTRSDTSLPCTAPRDRNDDRLIVLSFRTGNGLRACVVTARAEGGAAGTALAFVKAGDLLVAVLALAASDPPRDLAASVASSVEIEPSGEGGTDAARPGATSMAEPRLVGCFDDGWNTSVPGRGNAFGGGGTKRCLEADLTFTEETTVVVIVPSAGTLSRVSRREGTWRFSGGVLTLTYDDGREETRRIQFGHPDGDGGILADGTPWDRL